MKGKIRPVQDYIIVGKFKKEEEKTESGIILKTENDTKQIDFGSVLSIGEYRIVAGEKEDLNISVGDIVAYKKYAGIEIKDNLIALHSHEIIGVVDTEDEE